MYTLVVVDVQPDFYAANGKQFLLNCKREIRQAMKDNAGIVFLEYYGCGPTKIELRKLVDGYERAYFDTKDEDDGSLEVSVLLRKYYLNKKNVRVIGVNTDCCVRSTVEGLTAQLLNANITVVADACASDFDHAGGIRMLKNMSNVQVAA